MKWFNTNQQKTAGSNKYDENYSNYDDYDGQYDNNQASNATVTTLQNASGYYVSSHHKTFTYNEVDREVQEMALKRKEVHEKYNQFSKDLTVL